MKRMLTIIAAAALLASSLLLYGCAPKKILHCDRCGLELKFDADSEMEEGMLIRCKSCADELAAWEAEK